MISSNELRKKNTRTQILISHTLFRRVVLRWQIDRRSLDARSISIVGVKISEIIFVVGR